MGHNCRKDRFNAAPDLSDRDCVARQHKPHTRDLNLKRKLYGKYGVPEYWVVDGWSRSVIIFRLDEDTLKEVTTTQRNRLHRVAALSGTFT